MSDQSFVLYTYQAVNGQTVCHAYGPASEADAQAEGPKLTALAQTAGQPPLGFMVLPLETFPA